MPGPDYKPDQPLTEGQRGIMDKLRGGPPFTVPKYGSLGESIIAERNYLRADNERLRVALQDIAEEYGGEYGAHGIVKAVDAALSGSANLKDQT